MPEEQNDNPTNAMIANEAAYGYGGERASALHLVQGAQTSISCALLLRMGALTDTCTHHAKIFPPMMSIGELVDFMQETYPDVTISSVRFLEREGLLTPQRTKGGHRVYNHIDIERLLRIKEMQRQRLPLRDIRQRLVALQTDLDYHQLQQNYLNLILVGERQQAIDLIRQALEAGMDNRDLYLHVLSPAMATIGDMWAMGHATVADEHLATAITRDVMAFLKTTQPVPAALGWSGVAAAVPGDMHELGLKMVVDLFESVGWSITFLGANMVLEPLIDMVQRRKPHLVLLSVATTHSLQSATDTIRSLRRSLTPGCPLIGVGGAVFSTPEGQDVAPTLGADFCSGDANEALVMAMHLAVRRYPESEARSS